MYEPTHEPYLPKLNRPTDVSKQVENNNWLYTELNATQLGPQVILGSQGP